MPIKLEDLKPAKVYDQSSLLQTITSDIKSKGLYYLSRFDFESSRSKVGIKHYPLDNMCENTAEALADTLVNMNEALWYTFVHVVEKAVEEAGLDFDLQPVPFGEKPVETKLGKIKSCAPNRFSYVNTDVPTVQPYAFSYLNEDGKLEIQAEINFNVEIY